MFDAVYINVGGQVADANGKANALEFLDSGGTRAEWVGHFVFGLLNTTEEGLAAEVEAGNITQAEADVALLRTQQLTNKSEVALEFVQVMGAGANLRRRLILWIRSRSTRIGAILRLSLLSQG